MAVTPPTISPPRIEIQPGVWLDARLGLFFQETHLLVVADLHWGYSESHRVRGNLLPVWGDDEIEQRLRELITDYTPRELLWLGDSLHALSGRTRAEAFLATAGVPVTILDGNHDRGWARRYAQSLDQRQNTSVHFAPHAVRGRYYFHHGDRPPVDQPENTIEVIGHHHPAMGWRDGAGTRLKLPALVASGRRWILPAFSPWAAGTPWQSPAESDETIWAIAPRRIFAVPRPRLAPSDSQS